MSILIKKGHFCPLGLWLSWVACTPNVPRPPPQAPPSFLRTSAPPCTTLVVVLMILAWCHSFLELRSTFLWLEMYVHCPLFNQHSERLLIGLQYFDLEVVREGFYHQIYRHENMQDICRRQTLIFQFFSIYC